MKKKTLGVLDVDAQVLTEERERIRERIGAIGGTTGKRLDVGINITLLAIVGILFVLEIGFHLLPPLIAISIGVLLVSVKIVLVMTSIQKISHYEFWILNTIDFRISQLENEVRSISKSIKELNSAPSGE